MLRRWIKRIAAGFALLATLAALPLAWPSPLFAYSLTVRNLAVASDEPIPDVEGRAFLSAVAERLDRSPLTADQPQMQIYIANTFWRRQWLWIPVFGQPVGGFVTLP